MLKCVYPTLHRHIIRLSLSLHSFSLPGGTVAVVQCSRGTSGSTVDISNTRQLIELQPNLARASCTKRNATKVVSGLYRLKWPFWLRVIS